MNISEKVEVIREAAKLNGNYRVLAKKSGVAYEWLSKFSTGAIQNPTVGNVAKLESFFNSQTNAD